MVRPMLAGAPGVAGPAVVQIIARIMSPVPPVFRLQQEKKQFTSLRKIRSRATYVVGQADSPAPQEHTSVTLRVHLVTLWSECRRSSSLFWSLRLLRSPRSPRVSGAAAVAAAAVSCPGRLSAAGPCVLPSCSSSDISALPDSDTASFSVFCLCTRKKHSGGVCTHRHPASNGPPLHPRGTHNM